MDLTLLKDLRVCFGFSRSAESQASTMITIIRIIHGKAPFVVDMLLHSGTVTPHRCSVTSAGGPILWLRASALPEDTSGGPWIQVLTPFLR